MKVTISDIAKAANVAKSTVSKVLNDSPRISLDTKLKVREIMKQMNYTPSSIATGLARQSSYNIGLLIDMSKESEFLNQFFYNIIGGIESVIGSLKYELTIANVQHSGPEGHFLNRLVHSKRVDGLIANNSVLTDELSAELDRLDFPYIAIGEIPAPGSWVDFDNAGGGSMLTGHLLAQGYGTIAFVGGQPEEKIFRHRYSGYTQALAQAGLPVRQELIAYGRADEHEGYRAALKLLTSTAPPDAMVCMTNYAAFGALQAARELGVQVPAQLGIAAFDEYPLSRYTTPPLTSLNIDTFKLGVCAGKLLMEQLGEAGAMGAGKAGGAADSDSGRANNDKHGPVRHLLLEPELIVRESTRRNRG
ncbi:LacI family DNA-binding transcriptional regulator [Paenibacillus sp. MMS20-IR301]|uniref:LacI family DNA-binding transcriptional regulator n=1 Tax=Paenibacillus sp. MMS20-IR301 TaxID=2895946 RepID=UPI0028EA26B5|nr:LacI family DNA-binding transcriptional regulator [Paenibacillus sp. MMS20-IR301]WNS43626.1 LacI family DNA-binding transcriptional regulator [Paenibacillus sp. MMS20-IR301]